MRLAALIVDGNEYLAQCSAIGAIRVDKVKRNPADVLAGCNGLMELYWFLRTNRCQLDLIRAQARLVIKKSPELARKKDTEAAGKLDLVTAAARHERLPYKTRVGHRREAAAQTRRGP